MSEAIFHAPKPLDTAPLRGVVSHYTRVEQWECDYNAHWNTRFYARSFHFAHEAVLAENGDMALARPTLRSRHIRFHHELRAGAAVEIRSLRLPPPISSMGSATTLLHRLEANGQICATAIDLLHPDSPVPQHLPYLPPNSASSHMPRGLDTGSHALSLQSLIAAAPPRPITTIACSDLDASGGLRSESVARLVSTSSHHQLDGIGLTRAYSETCRINRMNAELRMTMGQPVTAGRILYGQSAVVGSTQTSFITAHRLSLADGSMVAIVELCLLMVDLDSRKVVPVPEFLRAQMPRL